MPFLQNLDARRLCRRTSAIRLVFLVFQNYLKPEKTTRGSQKCTSFSISKYGEELAFKKAVSLRFEKLKEAYGEDTAIKIVGKENVEKYVIKPDENGGQFAHWTDRDLKRFVIDAAERETESVLSTTDSYHSVRSY